MPKKHTYDFVKKEFEIKGYILLDKEYINSNIKMNYQCPKHPDKELKITYQNLHAGYGCRYCGYENRKPPIRKTTQSFIQELKSKNENIIFLDEYTHFDKPSKFKCIIHDYTWTSTPNVILKTPKCPLCSGHKIISNINDIGITHPEIATLFVDQDLIHKVSYKSNKKTDFKCQVCNNTTARYINDVCNSGFSCNFCSEKISFPERLMSSLLLSLNIDFEPEKTFSWSLKKEYDFYIPNNNTIIEMHGLQHYEDCSQFTRRTLQEEQENDKLKQKLAKENGIINYIIIDSRYSILDHIKDHILNSQLSALYDLLLVDWNYIKKQATTSLIKQACDLWNQDHSMRFIAEQLKLSKVTIRRYLNQGNDCGLCTYDVKESSKRGMKFASQYQKSRWICCITTNEIFINKQLAGEKYSINTWNIKSCLSGITKYGGKHPITNEKMLWEKYNEEKHNLNEYSFISN